MKWGPSSVDWGPKKRMFEKFAFKKGGGGNRSVNRTDFTDKLAWNS